MKKTASAPGYKFFRQLNTLEDRSWVGSKTTFTLVTARRFFASDRLQDKLARAGLRVRPGAPGELQALLVSEIQRWGGVIRAAKIEPE